MIEGFLANLNGMADQSPDAGGPDYGPTSIFHDPQRQLQHHRRTHPGRRRRARPRLRQGGLLSLLAQRARRLTGLELDEHDVVTCVRRGLDVIQADLNRGLSTFADGQFDVVVLSQTLQTVIDVPRVINEMLRVGRRVVIFPAEAISNCGGTGRRGATRSSPSAAARLGTTRPMS
ncbi:MAG: methionine biosynthesis protein MetW [Gemmataceae bacterium]